MFTGVALITFGGVGWLTGQLYNYGTIEKLKSAQELNEDSPNGVFGYVRGQIQSSTPLKLNEIDGRQFASLKFYWFQRLLQYGCMHETRELIGGPIIQSAPDVTVSGLRVGHFDNFFTFVKVDETNGADTESVVTNVGNILFGNRMRLGTIKETHAVLLGTPYLIYGEKRENSLWATPGYEDYVFASATTHESVVSDTQRNIGLWNLACASVVGFGIGFIAIAKN